MKISPVMPRHKLANQPVIKILLSETSSKQLLERGECLPLVGRTRNPDIPERLVIHLLPVPLATTAAACHILAATHHVP